MQLGNGMQLGVQLSMQVSSQSTEPVPGRHCGSESGRVFERRYGYWPHGMGVPCACAHGMYQPWAMACIGMGMSMGAVLRNNSVFRGSDGISLKQRKRTSRATVGGRILA